MEHVFDTETSHGLAGLDGVSVVRAGIDLLLAQDFDGLSRDELLDLIRSVEVETRRLPAVDHDLIAAAETRAGA
jgi:hypothetical protein